MNVRDLNIGGRVIKPDTRTNVSIPLAAMATHRNVEMMTHIIHGKKPGPCLFISAAIHGDEINGVEIIRRILKLKIMRNLCGSLIAIPIVNVHGFIAHSRYLPDGRDLNRSFPGNSKGSLAARMANTFFKEIVNKCTHGIDLHTGARHRDNLPQIRADLSNEQTKLLAMVFGVPAIINSKIRDGSLRESAVNAGIPILLYEAGEALRFDEVAIRAGVKGVLNVMRELNMLPSLKNKKQAKKPIITSNTSWVRAPYSGILRSLVPLGGKALKGSILGILADPLGEKEYQVLAPQDGIVIGKLNMPLVYEGDALFHLAFYKDNTENVFNQVEIFQDDLEPDSINIAPAEPPNDDSIL